MTIKESVTTNHIKLICLLGEGLTSCVYKALIEDSRKKLSQPVAIKILKSKKMVENWRNEIASLLEVSSKNCVKIRSWDWIENKPTLILDYIEGVSLKKLKENYKLSEEEIFSLMKMICQGLLDLKESGLVHGDLSPNNILIDKKGRVKLIDFGLANLQSDRLLVTPGFSAPELEVSPVPSWSSDLYSLGQVLKYLGAPKEYYETLIDENPGLRQIYSPKRVAFNCESLQEKVQWLSQYSIMTQLIEKKKKKIKLSYLSLLASLLIFSSSPKFSQGGVSSYLTVKPEKWHFIELGELRQYSPFFQESLPPGKYEIYYKSAKGSGRLTLTLKPNEHKILTDKHFH